MDVKNYTCYKNSWEIILIQFNKLNCTLNQITEFKSDTNQTKHCLMIWWLLKSLRTRLMKSHNEDILFSIWICDFKLKLTKLTSLNN